MGYPEVASNDSQTQLSASTALMPSVTRRWDEPPCNLYPNASVQPEMAPHEMVTNGVFAGNNKTSYLSRHFTTLGSA